MSKTSSITAPFATPVGYTTVRGGIVELLQTARLYAARQVNALMMASYWEIGRRIVEAEQKGLRRADYVEQLIKHSALDLTAQYGRSFGENNIDNMRNLL